MTYQIDENGFYGQFGGAYIPEILYKTVEELKLAYLPILESAEFKKEYYDLLKDYVGRPSPLYYAKRMSEKYGCQHIQHTRGLSYCDKPFFFFHPYMT